MCGIARLKKNKSCSDMTNVILKKNFREEWEKYPLSFFYMFPDVYTKKQRLERITRFLHSTRKN